MTVARGVCLFLMAAVGMSACLGAAAAPEVVTLYYWGNEADAIAVEVVEDFERLHDGSDGRPAIKVVMAQSASVNRTDDPQRLICGIAGGDPPDVVFFDRFAVGEWAARGAFKDLTPFYERDLAEHPDDPNTIREDQFFTPPWAEATYNERLYAVPCDTDNRAMYYNIDLFEKHQDELIAVGCVDPEDPTRVGPPRTWAQLEAATRILTETDESGKLTRVGFIPNFGNSWLYLYGWLNGADFMSPDGRTCTLNAPEVVEALAYMTRLYDIQGGAERVNAFQISQEGGDLDPFLAGKIAMRIDGDPYLSVVLNMKRDMRLGVTLPPAPEGKEPLGWCGGFCYVIPDGSEYPEEAWTFIKYMASRRAARIRHDSMRQTARAAGTAYLPQIHARKDITEWVMEEYLYNDPSVPSYIKEAKRVFVDSMAFSRYRPVTPVGQLLWNAQVRAMEEGIYKKHDPDDLMRNAQIALDRHAAEVQRELDRIYTPTDDPQLSWTPIVIGYIVLLISSTGIGFAIALHRSQARGYFRKEFHAGFAFALPWFIGFATLGGGPLLFSLIMSFCRYDVFNPPEWIGLKNYVDLFTNDQLFYLSLWNTIYMALGVPLGMAVSLGIALLLNWEVRGMAVYRTMFYLPAIVPAVAASILWRWIFNPEEGVLNAALGMVGIDGPAWLQDATWSKPALILMGLWGAGAGMIVWLAGLKGIPKHLYEAAEIDGAGPWTKFLNVTLPMISPYILLNLVMGLIGTFQIFTQAYIMTQGGPVNSTLFYAYALFNNAFRYMRMGYASAMAWILFFIILGLTIVQLAVSRHWVYYESDR